jgi:hypothetical protein
MLPYNSEQITIARIARDLARIASVREMASQGDTAVASGFGKACRQKLQNYTMSTVLSGDQFSTTS